MRVLITGPTGFVGQGVSAYLRGRNWDVVDVDRPAIERNGTFCRDDVIVHCAGAAHRERLSHEEAMNLFQSVNIDLTISLAERAFRAGVRRFIFISSVKAIADRTEINERLTSQTAPRPNDLYGQSKLAAERALFALSASSGLPVCVIRPPLIYGPGVKANFAMLIRLVRSGLPLPFGAIGNLRSVVGLSNLASLVETCLGHPAASGRAFFVSDGNDISTPELLRRIAVALDRPARLVHVPERLLMTLACLLGLKGKIQRITESLRVDVDETRSTLGWEAPVAMLEELRRTVCR